MFGERIYILNILFSILLYLSYSQMIAITIKENLHHT